MQYRVELLFSKRTSPSGPILMLYVVLVSSLPTSRSKVLISLVEILYSKQMSPSIGDANPEGIPAGDT